MIITERWSTLSGEEVEIVFDDSQGMSYEDWFQATRDELAMVENQELDELIERKESNE